MRFGSLVLPAVSFTVLALGLSACGGTSADDLQKARDQGAKEQKQKHDAANQKRKQRALEKKVARLERQRSGGNSSSGSAGGGGGTTTGSTSCGGGLSVNTNTSCTFAENVRSELNSAGGGSATIYVYSPVTGNTYTMRCTGGVPTICRGGNNAVVYIR